MNEPAVALKRNDAPHAPASALEAGVQIGDFRIERRLGAGGMGIVYQARQLSLDRPVALKVLGQALSRGADVSRFQREAQAAARLRHPAIAQVYYIGQDRHICYMAMELIEGISLRRALERVGTTNTSESGLDSAVRDDLGEEPEAAVVRFDVPTEALADKNAASEETGGKALQSEPEKREEKPNEVNPYLSPKARELRTSLAHVRRCAEVARDAAHALAHAHEQGVVHRDIKPDNLLLDRKGKLHLIDFGVARFFEDQAVTYTGQLVGTPLYMSPEQVTGRGAVDSRTDVYSLGLVLYELLTLRPPVEATNRENLLRSIVTKPLPPVSWRNSAVPSDLEKVVHRATQKDPDQRYASAVEMAADLERFLAGKPVTAPQYHFRLDEREITAARPGGVILAALIIFMISLCLFMMFGSLGMMMSIMFLGQMNAAAAMFLALQIGIAGILLSAGIFVGRGLLSAQVWARWIGVVMMGLLVIGSLLGLVGLGSTAAAIAVELGSPAKRPAGGAESRPLPPEQEPSVPPAVPPSGAKQPAEPEIPFQAGRFIMAMFGFYALPLIMGAFLGGAGLWSLLSRKTAEWFRFAAQIREEHRLLREQLQ